MNHLVILMILIYALILLRNLILKKLKNLDKYKIFNAILILNHHINLFNKSFLKNLFNLITTNK
jgi:hypothetical protein